MLALGDIIREIFKHKIFKNQGKRFLLMEFYELSGGRKLSQNREALQVVSIPFLPYPSPYYS